MIQRVHLRTARRGLSLLEVVVALAIFLMSLTVLSQLVSFAGNRAQDVNDRSRAARLCQTKMAEVLAGAVPLSSQSDTPFDEAPEFMWSMTADAGPVTNLYIVTVTVSKTLAEGYRNETSLIQMVLDPAAVGSTQDTPPPPTSSTSSSSTSTSSSGTGGS
jgi:prepilin-type N-terminal cleavage/methylation domain-containing protein